MNDIHRRKKFRQLGEDAFVDRTRAERAAGDVEDRQIVVESKRGSHHSGIAVAQSGPNRVPRHDDVRMQRPRRFLGRRKRQCHQIGEPDVDLVREPDGCRLLVHDDRGDPARRDHRRHADVSAGAEHDIRLECAQLAPRLGDADWDTGAVRHRFQIEVPAQFSGLDRGEGNAGPFGSGAFGSLMTSDPEYLDRLSRFQHFEDSNGRRNMPTRTAARNHDFHWSCRTHCAPPQSRTTLARSTARSGCRTAKLPRPKPRKASKPGSIQDPRQIRHFAGRDWRARSPG